MVFRRKTPDWSNCPGQGVRTLQSSLQLMFFTTLQGQTPGVMIMQNSGQAGEGYKVNIRGIGTTGNSDPLYVIDGVAGGSLNDLNPSDIESIDVLKDAASAAIYGARAANGVILVTTHQGRSGKDPSELRWLRRRTVSTKSS